MKALYLALIALTVASCTHLSRRPAATGWKSFESRCEAEIQQTVSASAIDVGEPRQMSLLNASLHIAQYEVPNRARAMIARKDMTCERSEALSTLATEISTKAEALSNVRLSLEVFTDSITLLAASAILQDPAFARKASCVAMCQGEDPDCARDCSVTPEFIRQMTTSDRILSMVGNCVDFEGKEPNAVMIFEQLFNNYRSRLLENIRVSARDAPSLLRRMRTVESELAALLPKVQVESLSEKLPQCPAKPPPAWHVLARKSITLVSHEVGPGKVLGSAFHIYAAGSTRLVTAEHVFNSGFGRIELDPKELENGRTNKPVLFRPAPGFFDRGNDIVQTPVDDTYPRLSVNSQSRLPTAGQRFQIAGFPGGQLGPVTFYDCTFFGYDRSFHQGSEQAAYVLSCPTMPETIEGISGGPMLDEHGTVWGVVSYYSPTLGRVYASPMSRDANGSIIMGIQNIYQTDLCLRENMLGLKRCTMMPNAYSLIP